MTTHTDKEPITVITELEVPIYGVIIAKRTCNIAPDVIVYVTRKHCRV